MTQVKSPLQKDANFVAEQAKVLMERRERCNERGHHIVIEKDGFEEDLMVCESCGIWFDKEMARENSLNYVVVTFP
jgi:hypothetical protein